MSWPALGYDPATGDVEAVRQTARALGTVRERAELVESRLRAVSGAVGPNVWRGPAADAFQLLLADVGPGLAKAAESHGKAQEALDGYAGALAEAQELARRAEADAAAAIADRDRAYADRDRAATEAGQHDSVAAAASTRSTNLRVQSLTTVDPIQQASIAPHIQHAESAQAHAQGRAADARGRERAAGSAVAQAQGRLDGARRLAEDAKDSHDKAAGIAAAKVRDAAAAAAQPSVFTAVGKNGVLKISSPKLNEWLKNNTNRSYNLIDHKATDVRHGTERPDSEKLRPDMIVTFASWSKEAQAAAFERSVGIQGEHYDVNGNVQVLAAGAGVTAAVGAIGAGAYAARVDANAKAVLAEANAKARVGNDRASASAAGRASLGADAQAGADLQIGLDRAKVAAEAGGFVGAQAGLDGNAEAGGVGVTGGAEVRAGLGAEADLDAGYADGKLRVQFGAGVTLGVGGKLSGGFEVDVPKLADNVGDAASWTGRKIGGLFD